MYISDMTSAQLRTSNRKLILTAMLMTADDRNANDRNANDRCNANDRLVTADVTNAQIGLSIVSCY